MAVYSVAEAKNRFSELIDLAMKGEGVVITRHGIPVVEMRAVPEPPRPMTEAEIDWLAERRKGRGTSSVDAGTFISRMRDEDWR